MMTTRGHRAAQHSHRRRLLLKQAVLRVSSTRRTVHGARGASRLRLHPPLSCRFAQDIYFLTRQPVARRARLRRQRHRPLVRLERFQDSSRAARSILPGRAEARRHERRWIPLDLRAWLALPSCRRRWLGRHLTLVGTVARGTSGRPHDLLMNASQR